MSSDGGPVLEARGLARSFPSGDGVLEVLRGVDLTLAPGEMAAVTGVSGSGKSTLLAILGTLDPPTAGQLTVTGEDVLALAPAARARFRGRAIGFVFQFFHLLPEFSARENVALPLWLAGQSREAGLTAADRLLAELALTDRAAARPAKLSGGEQQRVALARALVTEPSILLADEPTGNLDAGSQETVLHLLEELNRRHRLTILLATHNIAVANRCGRVMTLVGGRLQ